MECLDCDFSQCKVSHASPSPIVDMSALENGYSIRAELAAIGLGPMFDWVGAR